ncbi:MAG: hypothetical protein QG608_1122 [Actinomycetota bacterium]|nr:hypothetical protein [Actinomycetota bacterium]
MRIRSSVATVALLGTLMFWGVAPAQASILATETGTETVVASDSCAANDNLDMIATVFIGRCRKGSIRQEFPGEYLDIKLGVIKKESSATGKKAWKLLNDNRFKKS